MALSWNEIKERAVAFSKEWADTINEEAEAKPFLEAFLNIFGITRKRVSTFEHKVKKLNEGDGYIDLLWKGMILIEMKSRGKNLDKAFIQAKDYIHGLKEHELPKYILVSDFHHFRLFDTELGTTHEFVITDLVKSVQHFGFIAGYRKNTYKEQDPVNIKAAEVLGRLHDRLKEIGYEDHALEVYLVRILFCLFAEDTTIFEIQQFQDYIEQRTHEDGSDLAAKIQELFQVLNTPKERRFKNLDEQLNAFPYVNGKLFEEVLPTASFDAKMRRTLLDCCYLDWSKISPAIFGSMFQSVMNPTERRNLGAHYTSEKNILKLIKPLFLDELRAEFESVKGNRNAMAQFHKKLSTLKFLDPACGCGNFLVITYRELRLLEIEILRDMNKTGQGFLDVREIIWLDVDMMYGIEYEEFPARIAEVAMWLIDHQMNMLISQEFGQYFVRLPLKKAATILHADALATDWNALIDHSKLSYILGNPPFIGKQFQNKNQKAQLERLFSEFKGAGILDYVAGWYLKAAEYIRDSKIKVGFVSTNSITQGEQTGVLWNILFNTYNIKISFAHRTFKWNNEAKNNAAVYVVIIGFCNYDVQAKTIYEYQDNKDEPQQIGVRNINPYLVQGNNVFLLPIAKPICQTPNIVFGSMPNDGGHLLLSKSERDKYILQEPQGERFIKEFTGGEEFINSIERFCFWLKGADASELRKCPVLLERIQLVKDFRLKSSREATNKLAQFPSLFGEIRQPNNAYIIIPNLSSGLRKYIPIGFKSSDVIASNLALIIPNANVFHFGILTSIMHMTWVRYTCGMLSTSLRYSNKLVYNNYPWPENPTDKQVKAIEDAAQAVLDARALFPGSSLADMYSPLTMPPELTKAHQNLDRAVDLAYRPQPFINETKRMEFLFELYEKYTAGLFAKEKVKKVKSK